MKVEDLYRHSTCSRPCMCTFRVLHGAVAGQASASVSVRPPPVHHHAFQVFVQDTASSIRVDVQRLDTAPAAGQDALAHAPPPQLLSSSSALQLYSEAGCSSSPPCAPARSLFYAVVVDSPAGGAVAAANGTLAASWVSSVFNSAEGAKFLDSLRDEVTRAAGTAIRNPRSQWLTAVAVPYGHGSVSGHRSAAGCASGDSGACACNVQLVAGADASNGQPPRVPAVVLNLQFDEGPGQHSGRAEAALVAGLARLHTLGVDVCVQELAGAVVGGGCGTAPPSLPPMSKGCTAGWSVSLYRGRCPAAPGTSGTPAGITRPDSKPGAVFSRAAIAWFKPACGEAFPGFPPGWEGEYCGAAAGAVCVAETQIVRLVLRAEGGSAALTVDGRPEAAVAVVAEESGTAAEEPGLDQSGETDAVVVLRAGCHSVEVVFEDASAGSSGDVQVWLLETECMCARVAYGSLREVHDPPPAPPSRERRRAWNCAPFKRHGRLGIHPVDCAAFSWYLS